MPRYYRRRYSTARSSARRKYYNRKRKGAYPRSRHQFGKPARPELKHKVTNATNMAIGDTPITMAVGPHNIAQGLDSVGERVGNRISCKFCNFKMLFTRNNATGAVVRYVIWKQKNPTSNTAPLLNLTPISLINTQSVHIIRQGYVKLNKYAATLKSISVKLFNDVCDFKEAGSDDPVTAQRWWLTLVNTDNATVTFNMMNKLYYADA